MTEAVEGDLLSKLKALHRDRQIRISEITDNGWFPMRDEAIDVLFAALSRAEAERVDPTDPALLAAVAEAIGKADGIDTKRIQRREYAKHARAALDVIAARLSRTVQDSP